MLNRGAQVSFCRSEALNAIPSSRPSATILVVEDDGAIRYLLTRVLQASGYGVIACEDGMRAIEIARTRIHSIDAVITDSMMPRVGGRELIARIRALRLEIPVVLLSGSVQDDHAAPLPDDPATLCLSKPISPERLRRELSRLLSRSQEPPGAPLPRM